MIFSKFYSTTKVPFMENIKSRRKTTIISHQKVQMVGINALAITLKNNRILPHLFYNQNSLRREDINSMQKINSSQYANWNLTITKTLYKI